jgi:hypothetical protein
MNLKREVWEGWTVEDFIRDLNISLEIIMSGKGWQAKFQTKAELALWLKDNQPYYKKDIPEVIEHFSIIYKLK